MSYYKEGSKFLLLVGVIFTQWIKSKTIGTPQKCMCFFPRLSYISTRISGTSFLEFPSMLASTSHFAVQECFAVFATWTRNSLPFTGIFGLLCMIRFLTLLIACARCSLPTSTPEFPSLAPWNFRHGTSTPEFPSMAPRNFWHGRPLCNQHSVGG